MSDILARIRVQETHGIRRFLYPLSVAASRLPAALHDALDQPNFDQITLLTAEGQPLPLEIMRPKGAAPALRFAVSLAPYEERELLLTRGAYVLVDDPLHVSIDQTVSGDTTDEEIEFDIIHSQQQRFSMAYSPDGAIRDVTYDGIAHLRAPSHVKRNGETLTEFENTRIYSKPVSMFTRSEATQGYFRDNAEAHVMVETTACKSWARIVYVVEEAKEGDEVIFALPFAAQSPTLACDFGVGNGTYGKLQQGQADEVVWRTEFAEVVRWSVAVSGRTDYLGEVATAQDFAGQAWCHLLDRDKSLAVAITEIPDASRTVTVTTRADGEIAVAFQLGHVGPAPVVFGVCYHFLNDIPAIAAATNPQSILLPPKVEVLPA